MTMRRIGPESIFALLAAALILTSCAGGPPAEGADSGEMGAKEAQKLFSDPGSVYPNEDYIYAIGQGDSRREAENNAMAGLSRMFSSDVKVDSQARQQYTELISEGENLSKMEREMVQTVDVSSEQELLGIDFSPSYTNEMGQVKIVAYMDRTKAGRLYKDLVEKNNSKVNRLVGLSQEASSTAREYAYVYSAGVVSRNNDIYLQQLEIINPAMAAAAQPQYTSADIMEMRNRLQEEMVFTVEIEGDTEGKFTELVKQELGKRQFSTGDTGIMSIQGSVQIKPAELNQKYYNVEWVMNLSLVDNEGQSVATYQKINKESGISESQVKLLAEKTIEEVLIDEFMPKIFDYFHSLVIQE